MSHRLNKFNKDCNTSPKFYENEREENKWKAKIESLKSGKIIQIFPNNERIDGLHILANHLRS